MTNQNAKPTSRNSTPTSRNFSQTKRLVSLKKLELVNRYVDSDWKAPVVYHHYKDSYTALKKADSSKNQSCSSKISYWQFGTPLLCPFYLPQADFCMRHTQFILKPNETTCIYHPTQARTRFLEGEKEILKMQSAFEVDFDKKGIVSAYISDLKNDMGSYLEIIPVSDEIKQEKEKYLALSLSFYAYLSQYIEKEK
jgi:hypothetical protein